MKQHIFPCRIVACSGIADADRLLIKKDLQIAVREISTSRAEAGAYIILDFGKEMCGGLRILTYTANATKIRIRLGESLGECCSELGGERNATNDHALRDFYTELTAYSDMVFGNSGFRFARIDFFGEAQVKSIAAVNHIFTARQIYAYSGEDRLVADIFATAKRTVDLCASSGYIWDGIKRDKLVWIGDIYPEAIAMSTLYGRTRVMERSLEFACRTYPLPLWMNDFPTYSMWWVITLADYYEKAGAVDFTRRHIKYLAGLVDQMLAHVAEDGTLKYPFIFVDWPSKGSPDEEKGSRAINIIAAKRAIFLLSEFGLDTSAAKELLARLLKKEMSDITFKQVLGLKYMALGKLSDAEKARLVEGGAAGMSTFMSYFILKAVASFDKPMAIKMMKDYYGAMLCKGATTFWEDFDVAWCEGSGRIDEPTPDGLRDIHGDYGAHCYIGFRHSLCHGWSAGVIRFIEEEL